METIYDIYKSVHVEANKDLYGNTLPPDEFNLLIKKASLKMFNYEYGLPEEYQPGVPLPRVYWGVTSKITDDLPNCIVRMGVDENTRPMQVINGLADVPEDYIHFSSGYYYYYKKKEGKPIKKVAVINYMPDGAFINSKSDPLHKGTIKHPNFTMSAKKFVFDPEDLNTGIFFNYLKLPSAGFLDYKLGGDSGLVQTFLPSGELHDGSVLDSGTPSRSQNPEWPKTLWPKFVDYILGSMSTRQKDSFLKQSSEMAKQSGK